MMLSSWLVAEWNYNEIYSECHAGNCSFAFAASHTPLLALDVKATTSFDGTSYDYIDENSGGLFSVTTGDVIVLSRSTQSDAYLGRAFDWGAIADSDVKVSLRNETSKNHAVLSFEMDVVAASESVNGTDVSFHQVNIRAVVGDDVPPCASCQVHIEVAPYGR